MNLLDNEKFLEDNKYLRVLKQESREDFEVTYDAISCYSKHFSIYGTDKGWELKKYSSRRRQVSTPGCWLHYTNGETIDVAGDILTSVKAFSGLEKIHPNLYKLFERICHTIGNCIPWPEGGNLGGRPWKKGGSPDNYYRKLLTCKEIMENDVKKDDIDCVRNKIVNKQLLGRLKYKSIRYWIGEIWKDKTWEEFVKINFLDDMVDENLMPIPFGLSGKEIDEENLKLIYLNTIKMIISRGYRIINEGKLNMTVIKSIYDELGI